jgi:hypothetical protein
MEIYLDRDSNPEDVNHAKVGRVWIFFYDSIPFGAIRTTRDAKIECYIVNSVTEGGPIPIIGIPRYKELIAKKKWTVAIKDIGIPENEIQWIDASEVCDKIEKMIIEEAGFHVDKRIAPE